MTRAYRFTNVRDGFADVLHAKTGARLGRVDRERFADATSWSWWKATWTHDDARGEELRTQTFTRRDDAAQALVDIFEGTL